VTSYDKTSPKLSVIEGSKIYAKLAEQVRQDNLLDRSYTYYFFLISFIFIGFATSLFFLILSKSPLAYLPLTIIFSFFAVQLGGLMHDSGHKAIFKTAKANDILGHFVSSLIGMTYNSWKIKHNLHHANTNQVGVDDDVTDFPFLSFSRERYDESKGLWRKIQKHQVYFYYPFLSLFNISMRLYPTPYFFSKFSLTKFIELVVFVVSIFAWFILPFILFDPLKAILFFATVNIIMGIYLGNVFAPNHKGMPLLKKGQKISFLEQQIMTSRNISGNWWRDILYLGLNIQIEHHLFTNCPRNKLRKITPYVRAICKEYNLEYTETGIIKSNKIILGELSKVVSVV